MIFRYFRADDRGGRMTYAPLAACLIATAEDIADMGMASAGDCYWLFGHAAQRRFRNLSLGLPQKSRRLILNSIYTGYICSPSVAASAPAPTNFYR